MRPPRLVQLTFGVSVILLILVPLRKEGRGSSRHEPESSGAASEDCLAHWAENGPRKPQRTRKSLVEARRASVFKVHEGVVKCLGRGRCLAVQ